MTRWKNYFEGRCLGANRACTLTRHGFDLVNNPPIKDTNLERLSKSQSGLCIRIF